MHHSPRSSHQDSFVGIQIGSNGGRTGSATLGKPPRVDVSPEVGRVCKELDPYGDAVYVIDILVGINLSGVLGKSFEMVQRWFQAADSSEWHKPQATCSTCA